MLLVRIKTAEGETVIVKHCPNSFRETPLKEMLDKNNIKEVTVIGALSHMCIDATVQAPVDFSYKTKTVHATIMAAIAFNYSEVIDDRYGHLVVALIQRQY